MRSLRDRFDAIVARSEAELNLAEAALLIAAEEYPDLDVRGYLRKLDAMADEVRGSFVGDAEVPRRVVRALNAYLFTQLGFAGNTENYSDPRNSYLNDVLDRRIGIPITLSVIYIEVGRRLGLRVDGVSFPGHFLVKVGIDAGEILIDPFFKGALLGEGDLRARLRRVFGADEAVQALLPSFLHAADKRQVLARMLRNLRAVLAALERYDRALAAAEKVIVLSPTDAIAWRERGDIYRRLDCFGAAAEDYRRYLELAPRSPDAAALRARIVELEHARARLN